MKKVLTGLLVTALMLLVSNGFKENEITTRNPRGKTAGSSSYTDRQGYDEH